MQLWAILLAAGRSERMGQASGGPKQFLMFQGAPLYWRSALILNRCARLRGIVFVFPEGSLEAEQMRLADLVQSGFGLPWRIAGGGLERQDSVRNALAALPVGCDAVLVHDASRPFRRFHYPGADF